MLLYASLLSGGGCERLTRDVSDMKLTATMKDKQTNIDRQSHMHKVMMLSLFKQYFLKQP